MRKTIIFGAIAALFGLVAAAQASNGQAKPFAKDDAGIAQKANTHDATAEVNKHDSTEMSARERSGSREHAKEARERGHQSGADEDQD